jgi:fatty acid desaturase
MFRPVFRYSAYDAIPALCGVGLVALLFWSFASFNGMSWWLVAAAFIAVTWSYCWNLQCISHNFIHNPFFTRPWLNRAFGVLETLTIGVPHVLYHHYHMNHHWGDNDAKDADGNTRDWSSIYRHSRDDNPEPFWRYCLIGFFRVEVTPVLRVAIRQRELPQVILESAALGAMWLAMLLLNWRYFVFFYLPSYYLGWVLSYAEGYLEHYGCKPGNDFANSASSYNRLYNFLWFNNGYHQEHHWNPKVHWTRMHQLHEQIKPQLDANGTRTLCGPHMTAFLEDWLKGLSQRPKALPLASGRETQAEARDQNSHQRAA